MVVDNDEARAIAETFLDEMMEAERTRDFKAWSQRWEGGDPGITEDYFLKDIDEVEEEMGSYLRRDYMGFLKGMVHQSTETVYHMRHRFAWRFYFEKNEALITIGIHQKDGVWYPFENWMSTA